MKTSELISKLQKLEKEIPFDAEVVTGDDWQPSELVRVLHDPPYTFLEFDVLYEESPEEVKTFSDTQLPLVSAYLASLLKCAQEDPSSIDELKNELLGFVVFCQTSSPSKVFERLKEMASNVPG